MPLLEIPANVQFPLALAATGVGKQKATANTPCAAWHKMNERWVLVNALMGGTETMRAHGTTYLPKNTSEGDSSYRNRLNRTILYEGVNIALDTLIGKPFSEDVQLAKELTEANAPFVDILQKDIDFLRSDITTFARHAATTGLSKGLVHLLVDYSNTQPGDMTLAERALKKPRPYFVLIDPEQVIGWRYDTTNIAPVLSMVRIREFVSESNEWEEQVIMQVRVLQLVNGVVTCDIYRHNGESGDKSDWTKFGDTHAMTELTEIPFFTAYFGRREGAMCARPPLMPTVWLNLEHWQSSSEQRNILNVARIPIWVITGFDDMTNEGDGAPPQQITIGPDSALRSTNTEAKVSIVEHTGAAIEAGRKDLMDIEARMAHSSVELLFQAKKSQTSATESGNDSKNEDSKLGAMMKALEDMLSEGIRTMYKFEKKEAPTTKLVSINTDFSLTPQDAADLQTLYNSAVGRLISWATYLKELKRRGILAADLNIDMEREQAKTDFPEPPPQPETGSSLTTKAGAGA